MGGSVFGIKEAVRTLSLVDEKSVVSTPRLQGDEGLHQSRLDQ